MEYSVRKNRKGAVAVEFAMTAPLLFIMVFGALELGHANMVLNVAEAASYEGARAGIVPGATAQDVQNAVDEILSISNIRQATVTVSPSNLNTSSEFIEVQIRIPYADNTLIPPFFTGGMIVERDCKLTRESAT
ncbi:MAG: TadE/TadG family type IV pilus assembly protein [Planctomycetota bacterium]